MQHRLPGTPEGTRAASINGGLMWNKWPEGASQREAAEGTVKGDQQQTTESE